MTEAESTPIRPKRRHPAARIAITALWLLTAPLATAVLLAFCIPLALPERGDVALDAAWFAFMVRTFAFHAVGILAVAAVAAGCLRAPRLGVLATLAAVLITVLAGGSLMAGVGAVPAREAARGATERPPRITVMTANLWRGLVDVTDLTDQIERGRPDVLLFQEYSPHHDRVLRPALAAEYPFVEADPREDFSGMATYSRLPMRRIAGRLLGPRGVAPADPIHWERQLCCAVDLDGQEVIVQNIHLPTAPMGRSLLAHHHRLVAEIAGWLAQERRPVILAGDFNCTPMSAEAAALRRLGLIDAHRATGGGLGTTWGRGLAWPGFRIDHVYSCGLRPLACEVGPGFGSDHRPVISVLELELP